MRLIDADELLKAMNTYDKFGYTENGDFVRNPGNDYVPYVHYEDMVKAVNGIPTVELKMGRMTNGIIIPIKTLPMCGAKDEAICEEMTTDGRCMCSEFCPNKERSDE